MSNGSSSSYVGACRKDIPYPSVSSESVPSLIDNLVYALYGTINKSVINRRVVWNVPCDPNNTALINGIPRNTDEGLLCYIVRALNLTTPSGFVTVNGVQTLTNKTLTSPVINNMTATGTLAGTATTAVNIAGGLAGSIPYQTGAGLTALLPQGTAGQVLSTNGSGSLGWITNSTTSSATNNINGGTAGVVVYQTGVNTTGFTAAGTSGQVLVSNGTSAPIWSTNIAGNSGTATQLQTSRTLGISGDVTGTASFDGSANATIAGTIANGVVTSAKLGTNEQKQICKSWVNFNGTTSGTWAGGASTVTRVAASTTATVTTTNPHGLTTGNSVYALSGVVAGTYTVTVLTATTFTITTVATTALTAVAITFQGSTIRSSYNVSSITKNGTGEYTVNFATPMADANYSFSITASDISYGSVTSPLNTSYQTASSFRFFTASNTASALGDVVMASLIIFGN